LNCKGDVDAVLYNKTSSIKIIKDVILINYLK